MVLAVRPTAHTVATEVTLFFPPLPRLVAVVVRALPVAALWEIQEVQAVAATLMPQVALAHQGKATMAAQAMARCQAVVVAQVLLVAMLVGQILAVLAVQDQHRLLLDHLSLEAVVVAQAVVNSVLHLALVVPVVVAQALLHQQPQAVTALRIQAAVRVVGQHGKALLLWAATAVQAWSLSKYQLTSRQPSQVVLRNPPAPLETLRFTP